MNEKGSISNFLILKLGVLIAVVTLLGASITTYNAFQRTTQREKLKSITNFITDAIREADSLPGEVRLERKIPDIGKPYEIIISGSFKKYQVVHITIISLENIEKTFLLNKKINGGKFQIREKNPLKVRVSKKNYLSLEVI